MGFTHSHPIHPDVADGTKYPGGQHHVDSFGVRFGHQTHTKTAGYYKKADNPNNIVPLEHTHDDVDEETEGGFTRLRVQQRKGGTGGVDIVPAMSDTDSATELPEGVAELAPGEAVDPDSVPKGQGVGDAPKK